MSHEVHEYHDTMHECPKCGKRALTRVGEGRFHCIWCGFQRNISDGEHSYMGGPLGGLALVSLLVVFVVSLIRPEVTSPSLDPSASSPQPVRIMVEQ